MKQLMEGKVALITGGGTGLGTAVARRFSNGGASIVVTGRREDLIKTIAEETGGLAVAGDVTDIGHLTHAVNLAVKEFGGLDMVIANAGIMSSADVAKDWACIDNNKMTLNISLSAKGHYWVAGGAVVNFSASPYV